MSQRMGGVRRGLGYGAAWSLLIAVVVGGVGRAQAPASPPAESTHTVSASSAGQALYARCAACHLPTAEGVPGMFPPLARRLNPLAAEPLGRDYLVMVVASGLIGPLKVGDALYQGAMPAQGPALGDEGIAAVLNYVLEHFAAEATAPTASPFTADEVKSIIARYPQATAPDLLNLRQRVFKQP